MNFVQAPSFKTLVSLDRVRVKLYLLILFMDIAGMAIVFAGANLVAVGSLIQNGKAHGLVIFGMIAPAYVLLAVNAGALGIRVVDHPWRSGMKALWALCQAAFLTLLIIYLGKMSGRLSRMTFVIGVVASGLLLMAVRQFVRRYAHRLVGNWPSIAVLIRDGVAVPEALGHLPSIDAKASRIDPDLFDAEAAVRLAAAVQGAERVIVACTPGRFAAWSEALASLEARGEMLLPDVSEWGAGRVSDFEGTPTLVVAGGPLQFRDRIIKRLLDLGLASVATLVLLPVMAVVAIAIKIDSHGPVLFRQQRLGRDAHPFEIFKFRTMRTDMLDHGASKLTQKDDPRVTRLGAFLRKSSLDELPQLFNVLRGDMSIVGPRPHAAGAKAADKLYWEVDSRYWQRHCIKPGMTGLAQVRGHRGATHAHDDLINRLQSDLEYVTNWSIWRDVRIMFATVGVLFHKNAY